MRSDGIAIMLQAYLIGRFLAHAGASASPVATAKQAPVEALSSLYPRQNDGLCAGRVVSGRCGFSGNADFYGLGIRLGFYLQYAALTVALTFVPRERSGQIASFAMFPSLRSSPSP